MKLQPRAGAKPTPIFLSETDSRARHHEPVISSEQEDWITGEVNLDQLFVDHADGNSDDALTEVIRGHIARMKAAGISVPSEFQVQWWVREHLQHLSETIKSMGMVPWDSPVNEKFATHNHYTPG